MCQSPSRYFGNPLDIDAGVRINKVASAVAIYLDESLQLNGDGGCGKEGASNLNIVVEKGMSYLHLRERVAKRGP